MADARSVHTQRWVRFFARRHEVRLLRTSPSDALPEIAGGTLPSRSPWPGGRLLASVAAVRAACAAFRPDVLHAHYVNEPGWLAAASAVHPFVLTAWGSDVYVAPRQSRLAAVLNPWSARRADHVTCDSEDQRARIQAWGVPAPRISVIGWGVDTELFHPGVDGSVWRRRLDLPAHARVVFSPRQWLPNSNIDAIVRAHERLGEDTYLVLKRLPRFEGQHAAELARLAEGSTAARRIRVVSEVEEAELPGLYAAADCLITLCSSDGTPMSVLEAMAVGLPVVAFSLPSLQEWVAEPGGRTVDALSPDVVAQALDAFLSDPGRRAAAAAHNVAVIARRASREREMERAEAVYAGLARAR